MVRRFFKDSALYGLATILSKGMTVLMVPIYTAYLSTAEIGDLDLLLGGMAVVSLIIGLDISNALAREYAGSKEQDERRRYSSTSLWFSVAVFGTLLLVALPGAPILSRFIFVDQDQSSAVRAAAVSMSAGGIYLVVLQQLRWMMQPGKFGITSVSFTLVSLIITILLTGTFHMGVAGVLYGTASGACVGLILALLFSRGEFKLSFDTRCLKKMLLFCIPLVPSSLAVIVSQYISRFAILKTLDVDSVGIFGVGVRLAGLAGLAMLGFGSALTPLIYAAQNDPATPSNIARIFRIFTGLTAFGLAGLCLFTPEILIVLTRADYSAAAPLLVWLAPAFLLVQMYIFAPGPWLCRKTWWVAAINAAVATTAVILNFTLIPLLGLTGAAVATLLSAALHFGLSMTVSQRLYKVPHEWPRLLAVTGAGVLVMVLSRFLPMNTSAGLILAKCGILAILSWGILAGAQPEREWVFRSFGRLIKRRQT